MFQISHRGYGIDKDALSNDQLDQLRSELTVTPNVSNLLNARPPSIVLFMESSKKIYIPKWFGLQKYGLPSIYKYQSCQDITCEFEGSLRQEQIEPVEKFLKAAYDPKQCGGIINLHCAGGKTVIAINIIAQIKKKTLIIVHKNFLLDQWKERLRQFLPFARIGIIKAKTIHVEDCDVVIASLQSLSMKDYDPTVFNGFGFLIVDEIHRTGTEVFSQAFKKICVPISLGLSATVTRKDGMSKVFKWYIGDIVFKGKRKKQQVQVEMHYFNDLAPEYNREETMGYRKLNFSRMISNICEYMPRTQVIINKIIEFMNDTTTSKRRKILVLSERKNHLASIKHGIEAKNKSIECGFYVGGMKQQDLDKSAAKDVILSTIAFVQEGLDLQDLDTLILATPKSSIEQICGRIVRKSESDWINVPKIFDIVDCFSVYESMSKKRISYYCKAGFEVSGVPKATDTVGAAGEAALFLDD
jgi:superfamily II DNA or RNA helicase